MKKIAIATVATTDYIKGAQILFGSLKMFNDLEGVDLICFTDQNASSKPEALSIIRYVSLDKLPTAETSQLTTRFKFTLHKFQVFQFLEDTDYDQILFIDSDILITGKIRHLFSASLNDPPISAAIDFAYQNYYKQSLNGLGLLFENIFNTGFFILNRDILLHIPYKRILNLIYSEAKSYDGGDQGYLNWLIYHLEIPIKTLDITYNFPLDPNYPLRLTLPKVIHFTGTKPWLGRSKFIFGEYLIYKVANRFQHINYGKKSTITRFKVVILERIWIKCILIIGWKIRFVHTLFIKTIILFRR